MELSLWNERALTGDVDDEKLRGRERDMAYLPSTLRYKRGKLASRMRNVDMPDSYAASTSTWAVVVPSAPAPARDSPRICPSRYLCSANRKCVRGRSKAGVRDAAGIVRYVIAFVLGDSATRCSPTDARDLFSAKRINIARKRIHAKRGLASGRHATQAHRSSST